MNPAIQYERARERQAMMLRDPRSERLARRFTDPRLPALASELRAALRARETRPRPRRFATESG